MPKVFICYRRDDSIETAGRIYSWLKMRLPEGDLFFDVNSIPGGSNFRQVIEHTLADEVEVVLVVIGRSWAVTIGEHGVVRRRLEEEDDHIRKEIELALAHKKTIIPVLVQGAMAPNRWDLPTSIAELADINALPVRPEPDFDNDMRRVREAILSRPTSVVFHAPEPSTPSMPPLNPYLPNSIVEEADLHKSQGVFSRLFRRGHRGR